MFLLFENKQTIKAEEISPTPLITMSAPTVHPGNSAYISVSINHVQNLAALSFDIYYDETYFSISSAHTGYLFNQANTSLNFDERGVFRLTMASLEGIYGGGTMVNFWITTLSDTPIDTYPLIIAVGEAYDINLEAVDITSQPSSLNITPRPITFESIHFQNFLSQSTLRQGDTFDVTLYSWNLRNMATGNLEFFYDASKLEFVGYQLGHSLIDAQTLHTMNHAIKGYLNLSFTSLNGLSSAYPFVTIQMKVIENTNVSSTITVQYKDLYNDQLVPLLSSAQNIPIQLTYTEPEVSLPSLYLSSFTGSNQDNFTIDLHIDAFSNLAAGDFIITYDAQKIKAIQVELGPNVNQNGGILMFNETIGLGTIRFSYIHEEGLTLNEHLLTITFEPIIKSQPYSGSIHISGSGLVDSDLNEIALEFESSIIQLGQAYTITFLDAFGEVLSQFTIIENDPIIAPEAPLRLGYVFKGWSESFDVATKDQTMTAQYDLDTSMRLDPKTVVYNKEAHHLEVTNPIEGSTITYDPSEGYVLPGTYDITATISKEGYEDLILTSTLTISKAPITIQIDSKTSFFGQELLPLTYTVIGNLYDDLDIVLQKEEGLSAGTYTITTHINHPSYEITIIQGVYTIKGQTLDMTGITFDHQTFTYDGTEKKIEINGDLPEGIKEVIYTLQTRLDVGTQQVIARFVVEEGMDPVENMIAELTIEPATIEGITLEGGSFTYDGSIRAFVLNKTTTQYGDTLSVVYNKNNTFIDAGTYSIEVTLSHENYHPLILSGEIIISKAGRQISIDDFTWIVKDTWVEFNHPTLSEHVMISIDGFNYQKTSKLLDLNELTAYEVTLYIEETTNHLPSNFITIYIQTYRSSTEVYELLEQLTSVSLDDYHTLLEATLLTKDMHPEDQEVLNILLEEKIAAYNAYVTTLNQEYETAQSIVTRVTSLIVLSSLSLSSLVTLWKGRRYL